MWHKIASHEVALACASFILLKRWKFFLFVLHLPFFYVGASRVTYNGFWACEGGALLAVSVPRNKCK
jgi:hypothetical protein